MTFWNKNSFYHTNTELHIIPLKALLVPLLSLCLFSLDTSEGHRRQNQRYTDSVPESFTRRGLCNTFWGPFSSSSQQLRLLQKQMCALIKEAIIQTVNN